MIQKKSTNDTRSKEIPPFASIQSIFLTMPLSICWALSFQIPCSFSLSLFFKLSFILRFFSSLLSTFFFMLNPYILHHFSKQSIQSFLLQFYPRISIVSFDRSFDIILNAVLNPHFFSQVIIWKTQLSIKEKKSNILVVVTEQSLKIWNECIPKAHKTDSKEYYFKK